MHRTSPTSRCFKDGCHAYRHEHRMLEATELASTTKPILMWCVCIAQIGGDSGCSPKGLIGRARPRKEFKRERRMRRHDLVRSRVNSPLIALGQNCEIDADRLNLPLLLQLHATMQIQQIFRSPVADCRKLPIFFCA